VDFDQFVLKGTKVANPLLDEAQLLGDERLQPGPYHGASFGSKKPAIGPVASAGYTSLTPP
jgi:hypothetical protein